MRTNLFRVWMQRFACKWTESNLGITSAPFPYANQKRAEMPSVAEWDSIYNKSLEMISVRFFSPSLMGIESENCSRPSLGNEGRSRSGRRSPRSSQRSKPC